MSHTALWRHKQKPFAQNKSKSSRRTYATFVQWFFHTLGRWYTYNRLTATCNYGTRYTPRTITDAVVTQDSRRNVTNVLSNTFVGTFRPSLAKGNPFPMRTLHTQAMRRCFFRSALERYTYLDKKTYANRFLNECIHSTIKVCITLRMQRRGNALPFAPRQMRGHSSNAHSKFANGSVIVTKYAPSQSTGMPKGKSPVSSYGQVQAVLISHRTRWM